MFVNCLICDRSKHLASFTSLIEPEFYFASYNQTETPLQGGSIYGSEPEPNLESALSVTLAL